MKSLKKFIKNLNPTFKRYAVSTMVTFLTAFAITAGAIISMTDLNVELLNATFWYSVAFAGIRAGIKSVAEYITETLGDK